MNKLDVVKRILGERFGLPPHHSKAETYAPSNIALCKYWGKRDQELNLPVTSSFSVGLGNKGAKTHLAVSSGLLDSIILNHHVIDSASPFSTRLVTFLNLFRETHDSKLSIHLTTNIPISAGLASSACGFASLVKALNVLYGWNLEEQELSILARLGSGSASRSIWPGFVEWHVGLRADGMDSFAEVSEERWPELRIGLFIVSDQEKEISSREAMQRTVASSQLYSAWPDKVNADLFSLKNAVKEKDFSLLGKTAESNALSMHATMLGAWPPVCYALPETILAMRKVWKLRREGLNLFFTQDAGPNIKLLFLEKDTATVMKYFPSIEIVQPFAYI